MHHLKPLRWVGALVALVAVGCAGAAPTAAPGSPIVRASPSATAAAIQATRAPTGLPTRTIAPTASAIAEWNFDNDPVGGLPKGAEIYEGQWAVRAESDAPSPPNALCQEGNAIYPSLKLSDMVYQDVAISVRFKPISGQEDQAAGIIFRVQDKDNFYILRANALEGNVNFYLYAKGRRSSLNEAKGNVLSGRWQELRVEASGNQLRAFLNGQLVNEIRDDTFREGKVGLWTKADSVSCFDNVQVTATVAHTGTPAATTAPTQSGPTATATVQTTLRTDTIEFLTTLSSDDTVAVVDDVQRLEGVKNAQSSGQAIQVTYDPAKVSLQQIITAIEDYGVRVKK